MENSGVEAALGEVRRELELLAHLRLFEPLTHRQQERYDLLQGREVLLAIGRPKPPAASG